MASEEKTHPEGGRSQSYAGSILLQGIFTSLCPLPPVLVAKSQTSNSDLLKAGGQWRKGPGESEWPSAEPCVICNGQCGVRRGLHRAVCGADAASGRNPGRMADLSEHRGPVHWQVTR